MNYCKDCKHFEAPQTTRQPTCSHPEVATIEPVYGKPVIVTCDVARSEGKLCGPTGEKFAPPDAS